MPAQTLSTPYQQRPNLQLHDFLIGQKQNEKRYVPLTLVPKEIEGKIFTDRLELTFAYIASESASPRKFRNGDVELDLGRSTQKILAISVSFEPNYRGLLVAIEKVIKSVKLARASIDRESIQKSYNLITEFLEQAKRDFSTYMKDDLEKMFREKSRAK
ncbi:MAG TPA: hypothetical protein VIX17_03970 [Pyrinomonadaceae bacterium]|jgi:hypothetical protein